MTEQEWLWSKDPWLMMKWLIEKTQSTPPSTRKLHLFCLTCCWECDANYLGEDAERCIELNQSPTSNPIGWAMGPPTSNPISWAMGWAGNQKQPSEAQRASIIRDIFGNPFYPHPPLWREEIVEVDKEEYVKKHPEMKRIIETHSDRKLEQKIIVGPSWITQQVTDLAHLAYKERKGDICKGCKGTRGHHAGRVQSNIYKVDSWVKCPECDGRGYYKGTKLDNLTLMALADMMEEEGCNVGQVKHYKDSATQYWYNEAYPNQTHLTPDRAASHPILEHLRSKEQHYYGCWAVDLILGVQ